MANINLLPWREEAREKKKRDYMGVLGLVFIAACAVVYIGLMYIDYLKSEQQQRNAYLQSEIQLLESQIKEIQGINLRKSDIERRTDIILNLQQARNLPTHVLDEVVRITPAGIYLSTIEKKGDLLWVEGKSESNNHVSNMMRKVEISKWLHDANTKEITTQDVETRQFQYFNMRVIIAPEPDKGDQLDLGGKG
ncbi:fimbrial protein [Parashewanella curva]|uniref:Fimbrial protein n=1 Tax=Parashewanella curva TaxID=2338552 RepID=A0A3L8PVB2_9GAMM|nr:PilN domain-containing protein [Parashewanella curva]RLV59365.1 fimbrial protein [Parashewanella curva]